MNQYPKFSELRKRDRRRILKRNPGFINRVAERGDVTKATASRVFHGLIRNSPTVKQVIEEELNRLDRDGAAA